MSPGPGGGARGTGAHPHRAGGRGGHRGRPRRRRRRLRDQAVPAGGAARPGAGAAAPGDHRRGAGHGGRGPGGRGGQAGLARRHRARPHHEGVRPALDSAAGRREGGHPRADHARGLGREVVDVDQDARHAHLLAAQEARRRRPPPEVHHDRPRRWVPVRARRLMRRRLWLFTSAVAVIAALVAAVRLLVVAADRDPFMLALGLPLLAAAIAAAVALSGAVARRAARPVEELAEAAGRLGTGDPRPVGRRYGVTELDQVAEGLDSASRRVTKPLTADRELGIDASHQLRTPLTALSMRLEEMIASADDPAVVREEGTAALAQAERLADVVSQLLSPARRVGAGSTGKISVDRIVLQQITEWEPAFRRAGRKMVLIGGSRLRGYVTPGGVAQATAN